MVVTGDIAEHCYAKIMMGKMMVHVLKICIIPTLSMTYVDMVADRKGVS